jgi:hypothetical protein
MSCRFVARRVGLSWTHLAAVERGERMPPRPTHPAYEPLGELLGVDVGILRRAAVRERYALIEGVPWNKVRSR